MGGLDAGSGPEIHNANEALQVKSVVRQLRRLLYASREELRAALQVVISGIK